MSTNQINLLEFSKLTGIPVAQLKKDLNIADPIPTLVTAKLTYQESLKNNPDAATTNLENWNKLAIGFIDDCLDFKEACSLYSYEYIPSNTQAWEKAGEKCSDFGLELLEKMGTGTIEEITNIWRSFPQGSKAYLKAIEMWNNITMEKAGSENTPLGLKEILANAYHPSNAHNFVESKLNGLVNILIEEAKDQDQAQYAYKLSTFGSETESRAFDKVLSFVKDYTAAKKALKVNKIRGSREEDLALKKCLELGSFYELVKLYHSIIDNGYHERVIKEKIEELVLAYAKKVTWLVNIKDIYYAFNNSYSSDVKYTLLTRWEEIAFNEVGKCNDFKQLKDMLHLLPDGSPSRKTAVEKMVKLSPVA